MSQAYLSTFMERVKQNLEIIKTNEKITEEPDEKTRSLQDELNACRHNGRLGNQYQTIYYKLLKSAYLAAVADPSLESDLFELYQDILFVIRFWQVTGTYFYSVLDATIKDINKNTISFTSLEDLNPPLEDEWAKKFINDKENLKNTLTAVSSDQERVIYVLLARELRIALRDPETRDAKLIDVYTTIKNDIATWNALDSFFKFFGRGTNISNILEARISQYEKSKIEILSAQVKDLHRAKFTL